MSRWRCAALCSALLVVPSASLVAVVRHAPRGIHAASKDGVGCILDRASILDECPKDDAPWLPEFGPKEVRGCATSLCSVNYPSVADAELVLLSQSTIDELGWLPDDVDLLLQTSEPPLEGPDDDDTFASLVAKATTTNRARWPWSFAACYGGHQFGEWAGQLGDGRAIVLGEAKGLEVGLKGCGPTQYSRFADGAATFRGCAREFFAAEYLRSTGAPTTRCAALWSSSEATVWRPPTDGSQRMVQERAGLVARVSRSLCLRFGTLELAAARGDLGLLQSLVRHACRRCGAQDASELASLTARATGRMVAAWEALGFVHGVLNTDNFQLFGETLDFGPFAFVEAYDPNFCPNLSDRAGRYRLRRQAEAASFAVFRFAQSLQALGVDAAHAVSEFDSEYQEQRLERMCAKLALPAIVDNLALADDALSRLARRRADFTAFFARLVAGEEEDVLDRDWYLEWRNRRRQFELRQPNAALDALNFARTQANPRFVLRNEAIQIAVEDYLAVGEPHSLRRLHAAVLSPFDMSHTLPTVIESPRRGIEILT